MEMEKPKYKQVHTIKQGDVVVHNGVEQTVGGNDIKKDNPWSGNMEETIKRIVDEDDWVDLCKHYYQT